ncbi:uncharacterized protein LOC131362622 [Hemibagrus wyckioides]|uniref:uncharacterized protein LOC131362622 n=1 Tax=Hemibagrus wyckioides TaxID=337641 RepID=UPI00266D93B8|nr:uncharacterized protein LOC131362622 [Hemibagrus wyckioides]
MMALFFLHLGPVCEQATEPALVQSTKVHQDQMMVSLAESEEKHQKAVETITQLEEAYRLLKSEHQEMMETLTNNEKLLKVSLAETEEKHQKAVEVISKLVEEKFNLADQVKTLQDTVEDMGNQLCGTHAEYDELIDLHEREQEAHRLQMSEYCKRIETLTDNEKLLKVSLAEAEEKHQKSVEEAEETITKLKMENTDLKDTIMRERHSLFDMRREVNEVRLEYDELKKEREREQEAHRLQTSEYCKMIETLTDNEKLLKVSLAETEEKHQKAVEVISKLVEEKSDLADLVKTLRDTVEDMGNQLCGTHAEYDELIDLHEREQEAHRLQTSEYCKRIETLTDNEKLLKVSLAEAEEKHQKAVEVITKLEEEKSDLADLVKTLRDTVEDMGNQLCGTHAEYDELIDLHEREQEAHRLQTSEYCKRIETLTDNEKLLKVSLAETEEKHQKAVEVITKLEEEKSDLTDQVKTLRDTVEDMGNQICETLLHCDELKNECEKEQEAHKLLKSEYHERMETLTNNEKLLKVSLAEAEEKHQKAMETISQLEEEKSDLTDQVKILRNTVEDLGKEQVELNRDCDKLMDDYNRLKDTHNVLQAEHKEVKEQLKCCEELPKESLDQAKESKAVQPTDEHEAGMSGLTNVAMQDTVWYKFKKIFRKKPDKSCESKKKRFPESENVLKNSKSSSESSESDICGYEKFK